MIKFNLIFVLVLSLSVGCKRAQVDAISCLDQLKLTEVPLKYATGFSINKNNNISVISITSTTKKEKVKYLLYKNKSELEKIKDLSCFEFVLQVPLKRIGVLSTTYLPFIEILNELASIKGITNKKYIYSKKVLLSLEQNNAQNLGAPQLKIEKALKLDLDAIFSFMSTGNEVYQSTIFKKVKLPVVYVQEYKELHPLGRAEWVKFFATFFGKEEVAQQFFNKIANKYNEIKTMASLKKNKPIIAIGMNLHGVWSAPAINSDLVHLIKDAGGRYLWAAHPQKTGQLKLAYEKAYVDLFSAQIWLSQNTWQNLTDVLINDQRAARLPLYRQKSIYNFNKRQNKEGGNDYWESGVARPDLLITDLFNIFYPTINLNKLIFYQKLLH